MGNISAPSSGGVGGAPGAANFYGAVGTGPDLIGRILVDEIDENDSFPDSNIGFDTFRIGPSIAGDFSLNGMVDNFDFMTWQRGFSTLYDATDLADWQDNFGAQAAVSAVASVPEPSGLLLAVLGAFLATANCRRW